MTDIDFTRRIDSVTIRCRGVKLTEDGYVVQIDDATIPPPEVLIGDILSVTYAKEKVKRGDFVTIVTTVGEMQMYKGSLNGRLLFEGGYSSKLLDQTGRVRAGSVYRNGETLTIEDFEE